MQYVQTWPSFCKHQSNKRSLKSPDSSIKLFIRSVSALICCPPPPLADVEDEVCKLVTKGQSSPVNLSMIIEASFMMESGNIILVINFVNIQQ